MADNQWFYEVLNDQQSFGLRIKTKLYQEQSEYQDIMVFENEKFGTVLILDGTYQLSDLDEHMYHSSLTRYGMQNISTSQLRILVVGAGDGGIVRDLLRNWGERINKVTMVEIDQKVIDAAIKYFPQVAAEFKNPKLDLRVEDALKYIDEAKDAEFDLVLCDSTDPVGFAAGLIEEDFYLKIKRILKPDGIYCCQSGSPIFQKPEHDKCRRNLAKVFADLQTYYAPMIVYPGTIWSYTAAGAKILNRSNIDIGEFVSNCAQSISSSPELQPS
jgi:spermidine synthase